MVLHNDKWKNRARRDYMRKHGLKTLERDRDRKKREAEEAEAAVKGGEVKEAVSEEEESEFSRKKDLDSNSWRFEDVPEGAEMEVDPEVIRAKLKKRQEEEERFRRQAEVVKEHVKEKGVDYEDVESEEGEISGEELFDDELGLLGQKEKNRKKVDKKKQPKSQVRKLEGAERDKFFELQGQIKHQKMVSAARGDQNAGRRSGLTMELDIRPDNDEYKDLVEGKLSDTMRAEMVRKEQGNFDDNLSELLAGMGVQEKSEEKEKKSLASGAFDLDALLNSTVSRRTVAGSSPSKKFTPVKDDGFLDEILGE